MRTGDAFANPGKPWVLPIATDAFGFDFTLMIVVEPPWCEVIPNA
jgi:hypothetical protein